MGAPSWVNGMALQYILENPLARDTVLRDILLQALLVGFSVRDPILATITLQKIEALCLAFYGRDAYWNSSYNRFYRFDNGSVDDSSFYF